MPAKQDPKAKQPEIDPGNATQEANQYDVWIKEIPYQEFLKTNKPEIMLLGLLAGYGGKSTQEVLTEIVHKIRQKTPSELDFQQRVQQLHILSNLHQIQHIFENVMLSISELIDERKDPFFQRGEKIGIEKGIEKGIKKGREEGFTQKALEVVLNLIHQSDHSDAFIAAIAGIQEYKVAAVRKIVQAHPVDFREHLKDFDLLD